MDTDGCRLYFFARCTIIGATSFRLGANLIMKSGALYLEVYRQLLDDIKAGVFSSDQPLPAERFLCDKYHVSRSTLRAALELLNKAEIVYTMPGAGTFLRPSFFMQPLTRFYSFSDTLKKDNIEIQNDIISYHLIKADATLSRKTEFSEGDIFHKLVRLRSGQGIPLMLETSYLPQSRFADLNLEELSKGSMYDFLKTRYAFSPENTHETLRPVMPLPHEKELLQLSGTVPCILQERFTYEHDLCAEYTKSIIRGDKFVFHVDLQ